LQQEIDDLRRQLQLAIERNGATTIPQLLDTPLIADTVMASVASTALINLGEAALSGEVLDDLFKEREAIADDTVPSSDKMQIFLIVPSIPSC
jgi:hypothetical protein